MICGIVYMIKNESNGKRYIGKTFSKLDYRIHKHMYLLENNRHSNKSLQADFNHFGKSAFHVYVIERIERDDPKKRERYWMGKLKTYNSEYGYNDLDPAAKKFRKADGLPVKPLPQKGMPRALYLSMKAQERMSIYG